MKEEKTEKALVKQEKALVVRTRSAGTRAKARRKFAEYGFYEGAVDKKLITNVLLFLQKQ